MDWRETTYSYRFANKNLTQIFRIYNNSSKKKILRFLDLRETTLFRREPSFTQDHLASFRVLVAVAVCTVAK